MEEPILGDDPAPVIAKRKQRLKSPRKTKTGKKNPHKSQSWLTREGPIADLRRKLWRQKQEEKVWGPRRRGETPAPRTGIPDGFDRETATAMWAEARAKAEQKMTELVEQGLIVPSDNITDEQAAQDAMKTALMVMYSASHMDLKLKAAATILPFVKAKPEAKSKVTVQSAEDFLALITADKEPTVEPAGPTEGP
jgi:hypothetical protein